MIAHDAPTIALAFELIQNHVTAFDLAEMTVTSWKVTGDHDHATLTIELKRMHDTDEDNS